MFWDVLEPSHHHRILAKLTAEVPEHGTATFTVTMTCMKATLTAANNYRYTLIGDCRWTYPVYISLQFISVYLLLTSFLFCICLFTFTFPPEHT